MRFHRVALLLAALTGTNARVLSSRYPANPLNSRAGPESQTCASFTNAVVPFRLPPGSELLSATLTFCTSPVLFVLSMSAHLCPPRELHSLAPSQRLRSGATEDGQLNVGGTQLPLQSVFGAAQMH